MDRLLPHEGFPYRVVIGVYSHSFSISTFAAEPLYSTTPLASMLSKKSSSNDIN
ncbi:hypothetical protein VXS06_14395 [Photobacterium toruni]|uniref:Uncharacterized protein n=1 Tax=Photobacterium toruni TaxID=1935446 RepID=A0ABU6L9R4_9GAMM|nr:hypothetical protein [Photobacterium toruni]